MIVHMDGKKNRYDTKTHRNWQLKFHTPTNPHRHFLPRRDIERRMAPKSIKLRLRINQNEILHRGPNAQSRRRQRPHKVNHVPNVQVPILRHEPPHQPLHTPILQCDLSRRGIEPLAGLQGVLFHVEGNVQPGRESVCELDDADRGHDGGEAGEVGDGGADDEGDGPVDGDDGDPKELAHFVGEGWGAEEFDANVVVEDCGGSSLVCESFGVSGEIERVYL